MGDSILIVDDEETIRRLVTSTLACEGRELVEAADGVEALARVGEKRPDLIVLDLEMPNLDGFGVLEGLRGEWHTRSIPVIILSAREVTPGERARLRHQAVAFRQKSMYSVEEMRQLVGEALAS